MNERTNEMHAYPLITGHLYLVAYHGQTLTVFANNGAAAIQFALPFFITLE
jgi:hypothetical protein